MKEAEQELISIMKRRGINRDEAIKILFELPDNEEDRESEATPIETYKVNASGNTYKHDHKKPAMLPIPQPLLISQFRTPKKDIKTGKMELRTYMAERELKFLFFLLHAVWEELEPGAEHEIDVSKSYNSLKNEYGINENTTTWLWDSASSLVETTVRWTEIHGDERFKGIAALLTYAMTNEDDRKTGILKFKFNEKLIPILKEPSRFTRLRLHFLMSLSGRYAILLYGILEGYANYDYVNVFTFELDLIRSWLKIDANQYTNFKDFRIRVLEPAFKQINKNPQGAGFSVSYKPIKRGRKVNAIEITINKTDNRLQLEAELKKKKQQRSAVTSRPFPKMNYEHLKNIVAKGMRTELGISRGDPNAEIGRFKALWWESACKSGESDKMESPEAHLGQFVITKLAQEHGIKKRKKRPQSLHAVNGF